MIRIVLFFLFTHFIYAYEVGPLEPKKVNAGDVLEVIVSADAPSDLSSLKGSRLGRILYVLDFDNDNRSLKVIVAPSEKPTEEEPENQVTIRNIQVGSLQMPQMQQYFSLESGTVLKIEKYKWWIISILILLVLVFVLRLFYPKYVRSREFKRIKKQFQLRIQNANSRADFEAIYELRHQLENYFKLSSMDIKDFENALNAYQYKKEWSDADYQIVKKRIDRLKEQIRN